MKATMLTLLFVASSAIAGVPTATAQTTAKLAHARALATEREIRDASQPTLQQIRTAVRQWEAIVLKYPASGYSDNALWQGGNLALFAFERFGEAVDKRTGVRLLKQLIKEYPSSSLVADAKELLTSTPPEATPPPAPAPAAPVTRATVPSTNGAVMIRDVKRTALPDGVRVSIELDGELPYHAEKLDAPRRVFFDIKGARASVGLLEEALKFPDDIVREIRFGRHPGAMRVVMDMEGAESYSVFTLYDPFRIVIDFKRSAAAAAASTPVPQQVIVPPPPLALPTTGSAPAVATEAPLPAAPPPTVPSANRDGSFSMARQLGLGVSRVVIDAGHGGHDPGASANGISEAELTLDVALRLSRLLQKLPGVEVVLTRSTDVFIPLEERTAIANREGADLFLSIHANASRNLKARGVETYYLNFATNPEAEAIAARENAGSGQTMHKLPEIVKAIALNNKVDESRDFASIVQSAMVRRLSTRNKTLRDLGVKQAPFVVLIGAGMPSVLAEISFVTNKQEGALLKTGAYRQHIAEALQDAVVRYQQSLKKMRTATTETSSRERLR
jgi:N-acetylmuramoyl-L-alanine amidase